MGVGYTLRIDGPAQNKSTRQTLQLHLTDFAWKQNMHQKLGSGVPRPLGGGVNR